MKINKYYLKGADNEDKAVQVSSIVKKIIPEAEDVSVSSEESALIFSGKIDSDALVEYEKMLKEYALEKLSKLDNVIVYNQNNDSGIITFNIKDVFCQDAGTYFNSKGIAVRSGHHCAKLLPNHLHVLQPQWVRL